MRHNLWQALKQHLFDLAAGFKDHSVNALERELQEMENAFALLVCGSLTGLPTPPTLLGLKLLPYLEREMTIMFAKSRSLDDKLAQWADLVDL
ncbi:MAG: hypothetical protein LWW94_06995 [Candidatus Desulfofervidaceae bacterium]|nr:hypothetical protein [Candidatus Desulfofervidaceae bacterium]